MSKSVLQAPAMADVERASTENISYFVYGKNCIRVKEHFVENGKPIAALLEDVIAYAAKSA